MTKTSRLEIKSYNIRNKPILSQIIQPKMFYDKVNMKLKNRVSA